MINDDRMKLIDQKMTWLKKTEATGEIKCVLCDRQHARQLPFQPHDYEYFVAPTREFRFYVCDDCNTLFIHPRPTVNEVISFYPNYWAYEKSKTSFLGALLAFRARFRARELRRLTNHKNAVYLFDVGTGDCSHFDSLKKYGNFVFAGVEINPPIANLAAKRGYYKVACGTLEEMDITPLEGKFDIVTMYHVIEHAINPKLMLEKAFALLRPGGILLGQNPFISGVGYKLFGRYWGGYHYPRHLQLPTSAALEHCLTDIGFTEISFTCGVSLQPALSIQNCLVGKFGRFKKMKQGKSPLFNTLFLLTTPICILETIFNYGSVKNIFARKPEARI